MYSDLCHLIHFCLSDQLHDAHFDHSANDWNRYRMSEHLLWKLRKKDGKIYKYFWYASSFHFTLYTSHAHLYPLHFYWKTQLRFHIFCLEYSDLLSFNYCIFCNISTWIIYVGIRMAPGSKPTKYKVQSVNSIQTKYVFQYHFCVFSITIDLVRTSNNNKHIETKYIGSVERNTFFDF